jgi:TATA-binding protein-associated factor
VALIDSGQNAAIRTTAATQIAEIVKTRPSEFLAVVNRLFPLLSAKSWDTRTATAKAFQEIGQYVPQWDPISPSNPDIDTRSDPLLLDFDEFDITTVLKNGAILLASEGSEFDLDLSHVDPKERVQLQKKQIKQKLGLGSEFIDMEILTDADLVVQSALDPAKTGKQAAEILEEATRAKLQGKEEDTVNLEGLSARERNRLKRKAKMAAKGGSRYAFPV